MKKTTAYRGDFLVIACPYCHEDNYVNVDDDYGKGDIPDKGRPMRCSKCGKTMLVCPSG